MYHTNTRLLIRAVWYSYHSVIWRAVIQILAGQPWNKQKNSFCLEIMDLVLKVNERIKQALVKFIHVLCIALVPVYLQNVMLICKAQALKRSWLRTVQQWTAKLLWMLVSSLSNPILVYVYFPKVSGWDKGQGNWCFYYQVFRTELVNPIEKIWHKLHQNLMKF